VRFLRARETKRTPEEAAIESFGCPIETVDREWRAWARRP
jgi:hypothetical protein